MFYVFFFVMFFCHQINFCRKNLFILRHMLLGSFEPNLNWIWNFVNYKMILCQLSAWECDWNWKDDCKVFGSNVTRVSFCELQPTVLFYCFIACDPRVLDNILDQKTTMLWLQITKLSNNHNQFSPLANFWELLQRSRKSSNYHELSWTPTKSQST